MGFKLNTNLQTKKCLKSYSSCRYNRHLSIGKKNTESTTDLLIGIDMY